MNNNSFKELKPQIQAAIQQKMGLLTIQHGETGFTLLDGFFNFPIQDEISGSIVIGGPTVPMVAIIGNTSQRVFFFPLKALLPALTI